MSHIKRAIEDMTELGFNLDDDSALSKLVEQRKNKGKQILGNLKKANSCITTATDKLDKIKHTIAFPYKDELDNINSSLKKLIKKLDKYGQIKP